MDWRLLLWDALIDEWGASQPGLGWMWECAVQHGGPEHGDAQHGGPEHGDAQHGHTKVSHLAWAICCFGML